MWMKWRHKFAYGTDDWKWHELGGSKEQAKELAEDACAELTNEYNWSDTYRGIDYEIEELPPREVIEAQIQEAKTIARGWLNQVRHLNSLLKGMQCTTGANDKHEQTT